MFGHAMPSVSICCSCIQRLCFCFSWQNSLSAMLKILQICPENGCQRGREWPRKKKDWQGNNCPGKINNLIPKVPLYFSQLKGSKGSIKKSVHRLAACIYVNQTFRIVWSCYKLQTYCTKISIIWTHWKKWPLSTFLHIIHTINNSSSSNYH